MIRFPFFTHALPPARLVGRSCHRTSLAGWLVVTDSSCTYLVVRQPCSCNRSAWHVGLSGTSRRRGGDKEWESGITLSLGVGQRRELTQSHDLRLEGISQELICVQVGFGRWISLGPPVRLLFINRYEIDGALGRKILPRYRADINELNSPPSLPWYGFYLPAQQAKKNEAHAPTR